MSTVTNLIITCIGDQEDSEMICKYLNEFPYKGTPFVEVDNKSVAGSKSLECCIFIGAFNYLDEDGLLDHLYGLKEILPEYIFEDLQLLIKRQHDVKWSIINIEDHQK